MVATEEEALSADVSARVRRLRARARRRELVRLPLTTLGAGVRRADPGGRTRRAWDGLPKPARWGLAAAVVGIYILPNFHPPLTEKSISRSMFNRSWRRSATRVTAKRFSSPVCAWISARMRCEAATTGR